MRNALERKLADQDRRLDQARLDLSNPAMDDKRDFDTRLRDLQMEIGRHLALLDLAEEVGLR